MVQELARKKIARNLEETLDEARTAADQVDDARLKAGALAVVASVSGLPEDMEKALKFATADKSSMKGELLAVVARTFAEAGNTCRARDVALQIESIDAYWCVEAFIHVGRISRNKNDFDYAKKLTNRIVNQHLRNEALSDINCFMREITSPSRNGHHHHGNRHIQAEALTDIVKALAELKSFEEANMVAAKISSAYWRSRAYAAIALGLSEAIK